MKPKFVKLASVGNPDFQQDPNQPLFEALPSKTELITSFKDARAVCLNFIHNGNLGGGNWSGGQIYNENGKLIAYVSYNGRVWETDNKKGCYSGNNKEIKLPCFNIKNNIGKAKYVVNYYDGVKEHKDGSRFFDIAIFKNKKKLKAFVDNLLKKGYIEN